MLISARHLAHQCQQQGRPCRVSAAKGVAPGGAETDGSMKGHAKPGRTRQEAVVLAAPQRSMEDLDRVVGGAAAGHGAAARGRGKPCSYHTHTFRAERGNHCSDGQGQWAVRATLQT